jgi:hypothetical protein
MKTAAIPQGFPVGRLKLTKVLADRYRPIPGRQLPQMITPYGGTPPQRHTGSTLQGDIGKIQARGRGALSELMAAKANPPQNQPVMDRLTAQKTNVQDTEPAAGAVPDAETAKTAARSALRSSL